MDLNVQTSVHGPYQEPITSLRWRDIFSKREALSMFLSHTAETCRPLSKLPKRPNVIETLISVKLSEVDSLDSLDV